MNLTLSYNYFRNCICVFKILILEQCVGIPHLWGGLEDMNWNAMPEKWDDITQALQEKTF